MEDQRITILTGHYGSGKTSLAVALSLKKRAGGRRVAVADLDIVNPYFRTVDCKSALDRAGVALVASAYAGSNVDLPALPKELYAVIEDADTDVVLDVGGDDRGAVALSRFVPSIQKSGYEQLFTVNFYRPLTRTAEEALAVLREIEAACGLQATAIVNNSNLGSDTTAQDVLASLALCERLSELSGLPVRYTAVDNRLAATLAASVPALLPIEPQSMPIAR